MAGPNQIVDYKDLDVWKFAMDLSERCYLLTKQYPKDEVYGLTSQIRRASVSVAANIAEGYGRDQTGQFIQFLRIAQGSAKELETLLLVADRVKMPNEVSGGDPRPLCQTVCKMLRSLIRSLEAKRSR